MARTPQSFEKRQRERRKQQKREEKLERRLIRSEEKRLGTPETETSGDGSPTDAPNDGTSDTVPKREI